MWEQFPVFTKWNCVYICASVTFERDWFATMFSYHLQCCVEWHMSIRSYICKESIFLTWLGIECNVTDLMMNQCRASHVSLSVVRWPACSGKTVAVAPLVGLPASTVGMTAVSVAAGPPLAELLCLCLSQGFLVHLGHLQRAVKWPVPWQL